MPDVPHTAQAIVLTINIYITFQKYWPDFVAYLFTIVYERNRILNENFDKICPSCLQILHRMRPNSPIGDIIKMAVSNKYTLILHLLVYTSTDLMHNHI